MQLSVITASLGRFFAELQRRKVLRVAATYLVVAWVVLQVAVAVQAAWALSSAVPGAVLNLLIILFPAVIGLAWFFEITPQGIKRTNTTGDGTIAKLQTTDYVLAGALALVFFIGVAQVLWPREAVEQPQTAAETTKPKVDPPRLGDKSIAVLPFANLSPDNENEYFADGLTEELLNLLSKIGDLKVISRTSSFAFKGKTTPLPEIARTLGVRHILEGSVRAAGNDLRVTAQLIDVASDTRLWSETYDGKVEDIFALQEQIATAIASAFNIEVKVSDAATRMPTKNMAAYRLYLKAKYQAPFGMTKANLLKLVDLTKQAIELDESFAEAHAQLARLYSAQRVFDRAHLPELTDKAKQSARRALSLDPSAGAVSAVLAALAISELDWEVAVPMAARAVERAPSDSYPFLVATIAQFCLGNFENARRLGADWERINPIQANLETPIMLIIDGDGDGFRNWVSKRLGQEWVDISRDKLLAAVLARERGAKAEAEKFFRSYMLSFPQNSAITKPVVLALADPSHRRRASTALRSEAARDPTFDLESMLFLVGDNSAAIDAIRQRVLRKQESPLVVMHYLTFMWHLVVRGEGKNPAVKSFMQDLGLVDYWKKHGWPDRCRPKGEDDFECS